MVYGPIGAFWPSNFPARIATVGVGPEHIGNGSGRRSGAISRNLGLLSSGSLLSALAYPIIVPAARSYSGVFLMPETGEIASGTPEVRTRREPAESRTRAWTAPSRVVSVSPQSAQDWARIQRESPSG